MPAVATPPMGTAIIPNITALTLPRTPKNQNRPPQVRQRRLQYPPKIEPSVNPAHPLCTDCQQKSFPQTLRPPDRVGVLANEKS